MENIPASFQILAHSVTDFGITRIRQSIILCRMASDALIFNTKPLSRLTGCGRLIRIIAPPVPLFSATRTVGSPLYSIRGREEVSLCPCRLIAPCLPHRDDEMRLSLGLCHLRAASSAAPPHGICTRKLVWNCQCSKKEKNPFTNNQVLGGKD